MRNCSMGEKITPFLKWAGGKGQLIEKIEDRFPVEFGKSINRYIEPFVGGGALLIHILSDKRYENVKEIYINDINVRLINTYLAIQKSVDQVLELLKAYQNEYNQLFPTKEDQKAFRTHYYYTKRALFNSYKDDLIHSHIEEGKPHVESAALFIFLNRTCFNGLYRVNSQGDYNVPMGRYVHPRIYDEANLEALSQALQRVTILTGPYKNLSSLINEHTLVYCDPPYRPLTETASFTSYAKFSFNDDDQKELAQWSAKMVSENKGYFILSNSDPHNIDTNDNFFDDIYRDFTIERILAKRRISRDKKSRKDVYELLIHNK